VGVLASIALAYVEFAGVHGVPRPRLLEILGMGGASIATETRIPVERLHTLIGVVADRLPDVAIPLEVAPYVARRLGVVGQLLRRCASIRQALEIHASYGRLLDDDAQFRVREAEGGVALCVDYAGHRASWQELQMIIATASIMLEQLAPDALRAVTFRGQPRYPLEEYHEHFGVPVSFDSEVNALWLERAVLDRRLVDHDPDLARCLEALAGRMLSELPSEDPLLERVRAAIVEELHASRGELEPVARRLAMSPRTLQRRLTERATTYQTVLVQARRAVADRILRDPKRTILDAADALGYADLPSFYRAFKRWTGQTPADWRGTLSPKGRAAPLR
jgi:AraC-like DNA-binding protein